MILAFEDCELSSFIRFGYSHEGKRYEITFLPILSEDEKKELETLNNMKGWQSELMGFKKEIELPKRFKLFSTTIDVSFDNKLLNEKHMYGFCDYGSCKIVLSDVEGETPLTNDRILDTFYHERTYAILDAMNETKLSNNEKFVDVFSKLLRQAIETSEY